MPGLDAIPDNAFHYHACPALDCRHVWRHRRSTAKKRGKLASHTCPRCVKAKGEQQAVGPCTNFSGWSEELGARRETIHAQIAARFGLADGETSHGA